MAYPFDPITLFETAPAQPKEKKFGPMVVVCLCWLFPFSLSFVLTDGDTIRSLETAKREEKKRILFFMDVVLSSFGGWGGEGFAFILCPAIML